MAALRKHSRPADVPFNEAVEARLRAAVRRINTADTSWLASAPRSPDLILHQLGSEALSPEQAAVKEALAILRTVPWPALHIQFPYLVLALGCILAFSLFCQRPPYPVA